ncbi:hypothetical protein TNCV_2760171 [Trichonephila clavipes]|nr:hypothetical protein TNCV_2760171 [Trichonephila clavipes]
MSAFKIIATIDICSKANNVFQNSCTCRIINQNSGTPLATHSSVTVTSSSESQPPIPLMDTTSATPNSLSTSAASYSSNQIFPLLQALCLQPCPL